MERTILHCDLNGFFASVEGLSRPDLSDKPFAVCGDPQIRHGIILAKNEIAKGFGVKTAETIWQAKKKCPSLILLPSHHKLYEEYSVKVNNIYKEYTDLVEPFGIDESWLDVTNSRLLFGDGKQIADKLRKEVREKTGLTISVGVSFCKAIAKLGSDLKKPDATTVITRENLKKTVWPLPVNYLLYVGRSVYDKMRKNGIETIGDLANYDREIIKQQFGKGGELIYEYANGIDDSPVCKADSVRDVKSIGNGTTLPSDAFDEKSLRPAITMLSESVAARMQEKHLKARTVQITIKNSDFKSFTRRKTIDGYIENSEQIITESVLLLRENYKFQKPVRMITVTVENLVKSDEAVQLMIDDGNDDKIKKYNAIDDAVLNIRKKYGKTSVKKANTLLLEKNGMMTENTEENDELK